VSTDARTDSPRTGGQDRGGSHGGGQRRDGGGGGGGGDRGGERVLQIRRCACVVKGGRRFTFTALVVLGDQKGHVGWGYGKATEVPQAVEKAVKQTNRHAANIRIVGTSIAHTVNGQYGAANVTLIPALPGTGVIAGNTVRAILEQAGVKDILTKCRGSSNPLNLVRATMNALKQLRTRDEVARLRGVELA